MTSRSPEPKRVATAWRIAGIAMTAAALRPTLASAQEAEDAIVPYRPTVSNPAQLPLPGRLEAELGGQRMHAADATRSSLPYVLKLAFTQEWGLLVGGEACVRSRDASGRGSGLGDTSVTAKRAWLIDDATAFGLEAGAKLPSAKETIGSGHADYTVNGIVSRDIGAVHVDLNLNATRVGGIDPGTSRTAIGAAMAWSVQWADHWGASAELSGNHRGHTDHGMQSLAALTYSPSRQLTFDVGASRAHGPTPATTQWFAGVVFPVATLW